MNERGKGMALHRSFAEKRVGGNGQETLRRLFAGGQRLAASERGFDELQGRRRCLPWPWMRGLQRGLLAGCFGRAGRERARVRGGGGGHR